MSVTVNSCYHYGDALSCIFACAVRSQHALLMWIASGVPEGEQPTQFERLRKKTSIPGNLSLEQLEDFVIQLYPQVPQLGRVGFFLAKATKMRQLVIVNCDSVSALRREVKKDQLFIVPKRDLLPSAIVSTFYTAVLHSGEVFRSQ